MEPRRSPAHRSKSGSAGTNAERAYLGWRRRSSEAGRPRPQASAAARNAMATASSRRRAIASSVRCSTVTLLRIVRPVRPETFGGSRCSPGDRTDQLPGETPAPRAGPFEDPGRLAPSKSARRCTSTKAGGAAATGGGWMISAGGLTGLRVAPASAKSAAARSSPESKALPSPNHSSSWVEARPATAIVPVLITAT